MCAALIRPLDRYIFSSFFFGTKQMSAQEYNIIENTNRPRKSTLMETKMISRWLVAATAAVHANNIIIIIMRLPIYVNSIPVVLVLW